MDRNRPKTIVILTNNPFPVGLAGTSRILSYCKGFLYHGYQPEVFCIKPTESFKDSFNTSANGNFNGINFSYPGGTTIRVASFWGRRKNDFIAAFLSIKSLVYFLKKKEVKFVIFYGNYIFIELTCILICKLFHKNIYKEESENPNVYFKGHRSVTGRMLKWFYINKLYRKYSGLLVMTHPLRDFFLTKSVPDHKILVVPQTVDQKRFEDETSKSALSLPKDYIAYVGSLNQQKDGALTLVESFAKVAVKYPEIHLIFAGDGTDKEKDELLSLITELQLNKRVHYIGRISSQEIPALFQGAMLLASCRPKSVQSDYGFPTKVAEYLASGKPVVTTSTGELAYFLKDRVNAFVSNAADHEMFAAKISEVLDDYEFAMKVAQRGKELVMHKFSPIVQTKKIIEYCKD